MKLTKVIILIFLLVKSTIGFGGIAAIVNLDTACCSDKIELDQSISQDHQKQDQEEEDKGCCGDNCDCTCCAHGLIPLYSIDKKTKQLEVFTSKVIAFNSIYQHLFKSGVWQPPRLV